LPSPLFASKLNCVNTAFATLRFKTSSIGIDVRNATSN
jgi:hypothetical protein